MHTQKKFNYNESIGPIDIIIPQESESYVKLPIHIIKWQPYLNPIQNTVLVYIITRIHKEYYYAFPSTQTAADDCNICENTLIKTVKFLEQLGLIHIDRNHKNNRYFLKPPVVPNKKILTKYIPKKVEKFEKRVKNKAKESQILNFKKIKPTKSNKITAADEKQPQIKKEISPHCMRSKQNLQNLNLSKQQTTAKQNNTRFSSVQPSNFAVVDLTNLKIFKKHGISSQMAFDLSQKLDPNINIDDFIHYVFYDLGSKIDFKNKPGFLIHAVRNLQNDFLDKQKETPQVNKTKNKLYEFQEIKNKITDMAEQKWQLMDKINQDKVIKETLAINACIKNYNFAPETLETFYIDHVRKKYLGFTETENGIIDKPEDEITDADIDILVEKIKKLSL